MKVVKEIASPKYVVEEAEIVARNPFYDDRVIYGRYGGVKGFDDLTAAEGYAEYITKSRPNSRIRIIEN